MLSCIYQIGKRLQHDKGDELMDESGELLAKQVLKKNFSEINHLDFISGIHDIIDSVLISRRIQLSASLLRQQMDHHGD